MKKLKEETPLTLSREQLHRLVDHLPQEKLPTLADVLKKLIDEDEEWFSDEEIANYRRISQEVKNGEFVLFNDVFSDAQDV